MTAAPGPRKGQRNMQRPEISSSWKGSTSSKRGSHGPGNGNGGVRSSAPRARRIPPRSEEARGRARRRRGPRLHREAVQARADHSRVEPTGDGRGPEARGQSEEHTSELQSPCNLVCRLLLEKKKKNINRT